MQMALVEQRIFFLVIIYNKELKDALTLQSFLDFNFKNSNLTIFNNGPTPIDSNPELISALLNAFDEVSYEVHLENMPLSIAYNNFIEKHSDGTRFVLLDDDTLITKTFAERINAPQNDFDLELPTIISPSDGKIHYPIINKKPAPSALLLPTDKLFSIGSGLIISRNLITKFEQHDLKLFDECFALYGVDFSFFRRIGFLTHQKVKFSIVSTCELIHSLSRLDDTGQDESRNIERIIDKVLCARRYPNLEFYNFLFRKIARSALSLNFSLISLIFKIYFSGYHPRCKDYLKLRDITD
ncbi:glycosyltransferase family 2 protein [Sodalis ligni]|uniref:Glycosyl transferase family 2 n=1 Tax=Sodalis ligni TaxID=2697027 RepID=A0A4R1NRC6_9GAMM|nr:glycosyltransferase family A protein [Sodalis ligni]TCL07346.1 hypothetical protein EZJ58_5665 [Sodalis ligni]